MTGVFIETLGCKLNQAETEDMRRALAAAGYRIADTLVDSDVFILNSCTVTHIADRKARQSVRAAARSNPAMIIIITGCYAERDRAALSRLPAVVAVLGNQAKAQIADELTRLGFPGSIDSSPLPAGRNRSLIKIQDGCDHRCAYCIVPTVRPEKSCIEPGEIIARIAERQAEGCREVVLTGTEIGEYTWGTTDLAGLLRRILEETSIERLRISSLQPQEVTPGLVDLWQNRRLCRHFHLSLQSGSDAVLGRMRRRYSTAAYRRAIELIRGIAPDAGITTDVIAGFPGETDEEFESSCAFIESIGFSRLHVFPYSPRPGTVAATMPGRVAAETIKARVSRLLDLGRRCVETFEGRFKGQAMEVLFEEREGSKWVGYTGNYIRVATEQADDLANRIIVIRL